MGRRYAEVKVNLGGWGGSVPEAQEINPLNPPSSLSNGYCWFLGHQGAWRMGGGLRAISFFLLRSDMLADRSSASKVLP